MGTPPFPEIGLEQVAAEFERNVQPGAVVVAVKPLTKAYGHLGFWLRTDQGDEWLLKIARLPAEILRLERTHEATALALEAGVPAPRVLCTAIGERFGGLPYLVQEFLPGVDGEDAWPGISSDRQTEFLVAFGAATAHLHGVTGTAFTENKVAEKDEASWVAHVNARLAHVTKLNSRWETLPPEELIAHAQRLGEAAERVAGVIVPTLTHRDLFLRNTLAREGRFAAILDFEHARFTDPVMEFVKLDALLFKPHQGSEGPFMHGYRSVRPEPFPREEERLKLCWGLELLGAMPFYARNGQTDELDCARTALRAICL